MLTTYTFQSKCVSFLYYIYRSSKTFIFINILILCMLLHILSIILRLDFHLIAYFYIYLYWYIGKIPDAGKDWQLLEKGAVENEMVR